MTGDELRQVFLSFFAERGHIIIPSAPLVPENDPSALFTSAGMHPLVPYVLGEIHPGGRRLVNVQKCLRTDDIEEVGDISHNTFFEMLGFWSLGDYWKQDSLRWTLDWFTRVLGLEQERISVTVFAGDRDAPRDDEAVQVWLELGIPQERIYYLSKKDNWWPPVGKTGPCGPDSELFYDTGRPKHGPDCQPGCACGKYIEIGNNVFMQYNKTAEGTYVPLVQRNIDVGIGLERTLYVHQKTSDIYTTDLFMPIVQRINELRMWQHDSTPDHPGSEAALAGSQGNAALSTEHEQRLIRIIAAHVRAATFIIADGVMPGNVEQGYICRRLIRRAVRCGHELGLPRTFIAEVAQAVITRYGTVYPGLEERKTTILNALTREEDRFRQTLSRGLREFQKQEERLRQRFDVLLKQHQERSRQANQKRFAGGLADHSERTTQLHTATHLLQQALRDVLGTHVHQLGSNITPERLRFDFSHPKKLTGEEIQRVEEIVNQQITRDLQTTMEVCGGPHEQHTGDMGRFRIIKAETIGQGVQRIRADLFEVKNVPDNESGEE